MEALLYLAKINLFMVIFYCCYWLLFRKHTFFVWNRFYLLASLTASLILPSIKFSETYLLVIPAESSNVATATIQATPRQIPDHAFDWALLLVLMYGIGVLFMLGRLLVSFYKLFKTIQQGEQLVLDDYTLVLLNTKQLKTPDTGSFSFFKWLVVSKTDYEHNPDVILRHEYVHIRQFHSLDVLVAEFLKVIFWFNPVVWLYKRALQEIHEFLADQQIPDRDHYANFLVSYALNVPQRMITNHFFDSSLLKSRIQMIYKNRTPKWLLGKYVLVLPVAISTVFLTAAKERIPEPITFRSEARTQSRPPVQEEFMDIRGKVTNEKAEGIPDAMVILAGTTRGTATDQKGEFEMKQVPLGGKLAVSHVQYKNVEIAIENSRAIYHIILQKNTSPISSDFSKDQSAEKFVNYSTGQLPEAIQKGYTVSERAAQFPGGHAAMVAWLKENMRYPERALTANVAGIALVRFTVNEQGKIGDVVLMKSIGFGIDWESVNLVKKMPDWEPAIQNGKPIAMSQAIEIKFDLEEGRLKTRQGMFMEVAKPNILPTMAELGRFFDKSFDFSKSGLQAPPKSVTAINYSTNSPSYFTNYRYKYNRDEPVRPGSFLTNPIFR